MDIFKYEAYGGPNVGIYAAANDSHVFLPRGYARGKAARLEGYLGVTAVYASVAGTRLLGTMAALNNRGAVLPATAGEDEAEAYRAAGLEVAFVASRHTALGNLVCANDRGAVVSPALSEAEAAAVGRALGVEAVRCGAAGYHQVGAMMRAAGGGAIVHPGADPDEVRAASEALRVPVEPATVNGGVPFVSSGVLANGRAAVVGGFTSGPEIMMLTRAFGPGAPAA